jgi:hypothetical protein
VRFVDRDSQDGRIGLPTFAGLALLVVAFMVLSLLVTATGTGRFAVSMGFIAGIGYSVGALFDIGKSFLPVWLRALWSRRARCSAGLLGIAWICLVTFSCLATHATVSTAISSIERMGTWKMEVRGNSKAELASVEQQLAVLSRPAPPRPARTVREVLAATSVPPTIWKDSNECAHVRESAYFMKACAQVVQLRRELAASEDYERLSARATELRRVLADAPIVASSDPLPAAFNATLGRLVPLGGSEGVALLLTIVVELISCFGLAGLSVLTRGREDRDASGRVGPFTPAMQGSLEGSSLSPDERSRVHSTTLPKPSLKAVASGGTSQSEDALRETSNPPSNVLPMRPRSPAQTLPEGASPANQRRPDKRLLEPGSHVLAFVEQRRQTAKDMSVAAKELRAAYEAWCAAQGYEPLSMPKLAAELKTLGYAKWKSCGLIRYRDLKLVA